MWEYLNNDNNLVLPTAGLFNGLWFEYMYVFMYDKDMNDNSFNFISL